MNYDRYLLFSVKSEKANSTSPFIWIVIPGVYASFTNANWGKLTVHVNVVSMITISMFLPCTTNLKKREYISILKIKALNSNKYIEHTISER